MTPRPTTQEWELNDDLGDSHPLSLQQGGKLPANSIETRTAGRIFVEESSTVSYNVYQSDIKNSVTLELYSGDTLVHSYDSGILTLSGKYIADTTGWQVPSF